MVGQLEYVLIRGQCFNEDSSFVAELQLKLFDQNENDNLALSDTIVMGNSGYFQLKSNPCVWKVAIREGCSQMYLNLIKKK